jgi:N,N'-diacetylchitobiose transport system permease protein
MQAVESAVQPPEGPHLIPPETRPVRRRRRPILTPYVLTLPTVVILAGLLAYPILKMVVLSFQDMTLRNLFSGESPVFVGFKEYTGILHDPFFWTVVIRTIVVAAICVILSVGIGLLVALLMMRVSGWVRIVMTVLMILVWSVPQVVSTQVFGWLVDTDFGVVNWLVDQIPGVDFSNHSWYVDPYQGWSVIITIVVWGAIPFLAISLYAGLTQVPKELVEAAVVDGANSWSVFRNVRFPILRPLIMIVTTLSVIWDMGLFTQVFVLRNGKPEKEYITLATYAYEEAFAKSNYSLGSAISILTVILMLGVMALYIRQMLAIGEAD